AGGRGGRPDAGGPHRAAKEPASARLAGLSRLGLRPAWRMDRIQGQAGTRGDLAGVSTPPEHHRGMEAQKRCVHAVGTRPAMTVWGRSFSRARPWRFGADPSPTPAYPDIR